MGVTHTLIYSAPTQANSNLLYTHLTEGPPPCSMPSLVPDLWKQETEPSTKTRPSLCLSAFVCEPHMTHMSSALGRLWRNIRVDFGMPVTAATRPSQWPSLVLFPHRFELCVTLITLKRGTISCSRTLGAFYDFNCSIKALQGLGMLCHMHNVCVFVSVCLMLMPSGSSALKFIL